MTMHGTPRFPDGHLLVVASTNRPGALSHVVAKQCVSMLQAQGERPAFLALDEVPDNFFRTALYDNQGHDPAFNRLIKRIENAKKILFVVPQYNGSFPGILKTFIDGLPLGAKDKGQYLRYKQCALIGVSKGWQGNMLGISHLSDLLNYLGMHVFPKKVYFPKVSQPTLEALQEAHPTALETLQATLEDFTTW